MRGVDRTSVPRLVGTAPAVDPGGRFYAVVGVGDAARPVVERWLAEFGAAAVWSVLVERLDGAFEERLLSATVGWRFMLAGPEADVMVLRAQALRAGALPVEVRSFVTEVGRRRVHCAHCRTITEAVGETVVCSGCGRRLEWHRHFSRRLAAYLGSEAL